MYHFFRIGKGSQRLKRKYLTIENNNILSNFLVDGKRMTNISAIETTILYFE